MEIKKQTFECVRDKLTIRGAQYLPANPSESGKYPAVIVSHGFTGNYMSVEDYCVEFAKMGYAAFCFSFCGGGMHGEDVRFKSDGETTNMTIPTEVEDLITVKNYVKNLSYIDSNELILVGISQGGFVSGLTAARCGNEIKKLIMIYPAICIPDHARMGCLGGSSYDPHNVPDIIDCGNTLLGKNFHDTVVGMDPYLELAAYKGDVLLLQGLDDKIVNYSYAIRAKESYRNGQCRLQLVRNLDHGFDAPQFESAFASIRQFLADRKEILTIRVIITHSDTVTEGDISKVNIFFTGYCDTPYFQGCILPEGCDSQEYHLEVQTKMRAEYTLSGLDYTGQQCSIHIVNQKDGQDWKPVVQTDSTALAWMNRADLTAVLEFCDGGPTVRIYAEKE
ncbi:MAG: alpha/beta hydrolase [Lachnospiraceae bacterium]|nr:alpha/beta hydrolase [Lachnospiraceae bacterium]